MPKNYWQPTVLLPARNSDCVKNEFEPSREPHLFSKTTMNESVSYNVEFTDGSRTGRKTVVRALAHKTESRHFQ